MVTLPFMEKCFKRDWMSRIEIIHRKEVLKEYRNTILTN